VSILSPALLAAVALVLLTSGVGHLVHGESLRRALAVHGVLPGSLRRVVATALPVAEVALGGLLLAATFGLAGEGPLPGRVAGLGATGLFALFAAYLALVLRAHPDDEVPCACGVGETSMGPAALGRAVGLAALTLVGVLTAQGWVLAGRPVEEVLVVGAAGVSLSITVSLLPAARALPEALTRAELPAARGGLR